MYGKKDSGLYEYYSNHMSELDPNSYTYVAGFGFAPTAMPSYERQLIRAYSSAIGAALVLFVLSGGVFYQIAYTLFMETAKNFFGNSSYQTITIVSELAGAASYTLSLLIPTMLYCRRIRIPSQHAFPMKRPNPSLALASIPILLMVTVVGSYCAQSLNMVFGMMGVMPVSPNLLPPRGIFAFAVFFISYTILPAVLEEMLFRGAIMQSLRRFGDGFALMVSSLLFALVHGNLVQAPMAFLSGLALGYFALRTGSLRTGMIAHFVNNALALSWTVLISNQGVRERELFLNGMYLLYLVAGLLATAYVVRCHPNMFRLHSPRCVASEPVKLRAFFTTPGIWLFFVTIFIYGAQFFILIR